MPAGHWTLSTTSSPMVDASVFRTHVDLGVARGPRTHGNRRATHKPGMIASDHGTDFTCNAMLVWCKDADIDWHFIAPGKPMQNGYARKSQLLE